MPGFEGLDIDKMFAEAANAAEETGEGNVGGKETVKKIEQPKPQPRQEPVAPKPDPVVTQSKQEPVKQQPKPEQIATKPDPVPTQIKQEPRQEPVVKPGPTPAAQPSAGILNTPKGITEDSIGKILVMNEIYTKFDETQKNFVAGYFQLAEGQGNVSTVIYKALTASQRDLDALNKIVVSKGHEPAERAFFLMSLDNSVIEDIYEQVEILTGELGAKGKVNDGNKLNVCRKLEGVIAAMPKDVFTYIERLQKFTDKAVSN